MLTPDTQSSLLDSVRLGIAAGALHSRAIRHDNLVLAIVGCVRHAAKQPGRMLDSNTGTGQKPYKILKGLIGRFRAL